MRGEQNGRRAGVLVGGVTLPKFFRFIGRYWWIYLVSIALSVVAGVGYLQNARYIYSVTMLVTPVQSPISRLPGGLENIASLAGINLPSSPESGSFQVYLDALHSRATADAVAQKQDLMREMYPREWSEADQMWRDPNDQFEKTLNYIRGILGVPLVGWRPPDGERLQVYLARELSIQKTRTSPVVTVLLYTDRPQFGQKLLVALHDSVDAILRQRSLKRSESYIQYLTQALRTITIADYREALVTALSEQEKTRMMASSGVAFVAEPFGQPVISPRPTSPKIVGVLLPVLLLGLLLATFLAALLDGYFRRLWASSEAKEAAAREYVEHLRSVRAAE